jgi:hypothetical protein
MVLLFRILAALALTLAGGGVFAQVSAPDSAFDRFYAQVTGVGKQTVTFGSGGQPVVGQGVPQISTVGGPVNVDRALPLRNNSGGLINASARISIPPATLAKIITRGLGAVSVLGAGVALYDLAQELGFLVQKDGANVVVAKPPTDSCVNGPCYEYRSTNWADSGWLKPSGIDAYMRSAFIANTSPRTINSTSISGNQWSVNHTLTEPCCGGVPAGYTSTSNYTLQVREVAPYSGTPTPSSMSELESAIASKSGWPSNSKVSQAVADATALVPAGPFPATPQVTGPATSDGQTKTVVNVDNSTTTTTTQHHHTYTGDTINTTTTTTTSTCTGGSCNTTTETETPKLDEQPFAMPCGIAGTPPCAVKVDDSGMPPDGGNALKQETDDVDPQKTSILDKLGEIEEWDLGEWSWTFQLPTGCTPLPMFLGVEINPCQWQEEIHDVMTVVWLLTGITGCFVIFSRAFQ